MHFTVLVPIQFILAVDCFGSEYSYLQLTFLVQNTVTGSLLVWFRSKRGGGSMIIDEVTASHNESWQLCSLITWYYQRSW